MNVNQLFTMKSKEEACFILYNKCLYCNHFYQNQWGAWNCDSPWNEDFCRKYWEEFLQKILDKNTFKGYN